MTPVINIVRDFSDGIRLIKLLDNILGVRAHSARARAWTARSLARSLNLGARPSEQEMSADKQQELGRGSLKKYNKNPRMDIQKIENLNKPIALINHFCQDVGIKISIAAEGESRCQLYNLLERPPSDPVGDHRCARRGGPAHHSGDGVDPDQQVCDRRH